MSDREAIDTCRRAAEIIGATFDGLWLRLQLPDDCQCDECSEGWYD